MSKVEGESSAMNSSLFEAAKKGDVHSLKEALKKGANPNYAARSEEGAPTSLHEAVKIQHEDGEECTKVLLENGADIDSTLLTNCNTPLIGAAAAGADNICRLLIEKSEERLNAESDSEDEYPGDSLQPAPKRFVSRSNSYGNTPLHAGVRAGSVETVRLLMEHDANLEATNHVGSTLLHLCAFLCEQTETSDSIHISNTSSTQSRRASRLNAVEPRVQIAAMVIASGKSGDIDSKDHNGMTALHIAAQRGCISLVKLFVDSGASLSIKTALNYKGKGGRNAEQSAEFSGMKETKELLQQMNEMKQTDKSIIVTHNMAKDLEGGYSVSNPVVGSGGAAVRRRSYSEKRDSETSSVSL